MALGPRRRSPPPPPPARGILLVLLAAAAAMAPAALALQLKYPTPAQLQHEGPLPSARDVGLEYLRVPGGRYGEAGNALERRSHEIGRPRTTPTSRVKFACLLRRRDGIEMYGRQIIHDPDVDPNYATLVWRNGKEEGARWDATLLLKPRSLVGSSTREAEKSECFVAMNRFAVKAGCEVDFERRWAERESKLPAQPGFLGFSLLRKRKDLEGGSAPPSPPNPEDVYNYSTCTIWTSFKQWSHWRDGEGRYSHDASNKAVARTPISEWLDAPASPIFWDGLGMVLSESGV